MKLRRLSVISLLVLLLSALWCAAAEAASATLTWADNSTNEQGFNIVRKAEVCTGTGAFAPLVTVGANVVSYVDLTVVEGATYCYRLNAYNTAGTSGWSNNGGITIQYTVPPGPSNLVVTPGP